MKTDTDITPGRHISYWLYNDLEPLAFEPLQQDTDADVVIAGGGIAGLTVAYCLLKSGKNVVVIEDGYIGSGETGHTSAHLTSALDDRYYHLEKLFGEEKIRLIADSHAKAIDLVERIVKQENIDCDFKRISGYLFLHATDTKESLDKELESAKKAGLKVQLLDHIPGMKGEDGHKAIEFKNQARFDPLKYLSGLSKAVTGLGGRIYTKTHVKEISSEGMVTDNGFKVTARHVVVATNTPVNSKLVIPAKQYPYRTYMIGAFIRKDSLPDALWWDTGDFEANASIPPYHYVRLQPLQGNKDYDLLLCGGEDHATGLADAESVPEESRYALLEEWAGKRFNIRDVIYRWSGQVMEPMDSLGYIGHSPLEKSDNIYIVTGDSGNGLTHANIAGLLITDLINGTENPWKEIYDPSRIKWKAAGTFFKEFVGGLFAYYKNKPDPETSRLSALKKDEGMMVKWGGRVCGMYRDHNDRLHIVDASCTHMQCTVKWNNDEKTWDCPCHGSRFSTEGKVLNGPANRDLDYHTEESFTEISAL